MSSSNPVDKLPAEIVLEICARLDWTTNLTISTIRPFSEAAGESLFRKDAVPYSDQGSRALMWAALHNDLNILERSLKAGGRHLLNSYSRVEEFDAYVTPLYAAAAKGHTAVLEALLTAGALIHCDSI